MKIVIFNTWYFPNMMGGAEHSVKILAENLVKKGQKVVVVTVDSPTKKTVCENINGVKVYRLNSGKYKLFDAYAKKYKGFKQLKNKYYELFNKSINNELDRVLKKIKPDIVHVNCISGLSFKAIECVHEHSIPIIYTLRNYFMLNPTNREMPKILTYIYKKIVKNYSNYAIAVTAPSLFTLKKHLQLGLFDKVKIKKCIPNCIDIPYNTTIKEINLHRQREKKVTNFIYAGWISEDKGIRYLLKAFNNIKTDATLTLCGDGDLRQLVKDAAKQNKNIKYLGKLDTQALYHQYELADVSIVPSIWEEPFGRVVIEANAYGLPVIASDQGGIPEIISTVAGGVVYESKNISALTSKMELFCNKKKRMGYLHNIQDNIMKYSVEVQIDDFSALYCKAINVNRSN